MTGITFCGNCPVDPTLLSLVHNEVLQLSSSLEDFVCQFKEQYDLLKSQVFEVKQNLEELLELPQKFKQMEHEMKTLKQQMADLSCSAMKRQQSVNPPSFFGALERGCNGGLLRNSLGFSQRAILLKGSNATVEENVISEHCTWGIVVCCGSNLICKQTTFENNCCGGLRVMLNGRGNVLVEKCEFRKNLGPDIFPANAKELCLLDLQCEEMFTSHQESAIMFYLRNFLQLTKTDKFEDADEFKSPLLLENRFSDVPDVLSWEPPERCSGCWKDQHSVGNFIKCSSCLVARYCSKQCSDAARDVHSFVCNSILEANKECQPLQLLSSSPIKADCQRKAGNCLCVITALLIVLAPAESRGGISILTCPQRNLHTVLKSADLYSFVMIHGAPIKESMMDIKAASILANFDPESHTVTVYWHRIFPVDKVPNGWKWVNRSLDLFAKSSTREDTS